MMQPSCAEEAEAISPEDALEYARELRADLVARLAAVVG